LKGYNCPIEAIIEVIGGKWKSLILWHLQDNTRRTGELKKLIPGITQKMLIQQLKSLEKQGYVKRVVYPEVPPKVEYSLTPHGEELEPLLQDMCRWGRQYLNRIS